jgi:hypothetical protein
MGMDEAARYQAYLASGQSGPYNLDDLRQLLASGRAIPEDRVMDLSTTQPSTFAQLIPEAFDIARAGNAQRVRRSSDRLPVVRTSSPKPRGTDRIVKPERKLDPDVSATTAMNQPQKSDRVRIIPDARPARDTSALTQSLMVAALLVILVIATYSIIAETFDGIGTTPKFTLNSPIGAWSLRGFNDSPASWVINIPQSGQLTITGTDQRSFSSTFTQREDGTQAFLIRSSDRHPILGDSFRLFVENGSPRITIGTQTLSASMVGR